MSFVIGRGRQARETYPVSAGAAGSAASGVPLSRQRFIDGDTSNPGPGAAAAPFKTIASFMASRGNASVADATANYVGWIMPALGGYVGDVAFPAYVSTELRADSFSALSGTVITGNATWANVGGAHAATVAIAIAHNLIVSGSFTVTDDGGAPPSGVIFGSDESGLNSSAIGGGFDSHTTVNLSSVSFYNSIISVGINAGFDSTQRAGVVMIESYCTGDVSGSTIAAEYSSFASSTIKAFSNASFISCSFGGAAVLTCPASTFDGASWRSFVEAGGTRAAGSVVLVTGGYSGGAVEGAALSTGALVSVTVSLNGVAASAGFTAEHSGNHYSTASVTQTSVTLATGGALPGDTLLITRTDVVAANLAVINGGGGAGTIGTIPTGTKGFVLARYDGTNWVFAEGGSLAA
jgi:hypothetical protein